MLLKLLERTSTLLYWIEICFTARLTEALFIIITRIFRGRLLKMWWCDLRLFYYQAWVRWWDCLNVD